MRTDHQALVTLLGSSGKGRAPMRIARWVERLRRYNFVVEYRPGTSNNVPDMLSRLPMEGTSFSTGDESENVVAHLETSCKPISWGEISEQSDADRELCMIREWLRVSNPKISDRRWASVIHELSEQQGIVFRAEKIILPHTLRAKAIELAHGDAHQGMVRTKQRLRQIYWWPSMDTMVETAIKGCSICANSDRTVKSAVAPVTPIPWPTQAWEKVAVDIRGPDSSLGVQSRFQVVVIDYYSKWAEVELMREVSASRVVGMFGRLFNREGIPKCIISDNGVQFFSREFAAMIEEHGIRHIKSPVFHPATNGLVERFNRTLGGFIATAKMKNGDTRENVLKMVATYNATPQATTGKAPAELLHGRRMRTKLDVAGAPGQAENDDDTRARVQNRQAQQKAYADKRRAPDKGGFEIGEWVRTRKPQWKKGESRFNVPVQIRKRIGLPTHQASDGKVWHRDSLVKYEGGVPGAPQCEDRSEPNARQPDTQVFQADGSLLDMSFEINSGQETEEGKEEAGERSDTPDFNATLRPEEETKPPGAADTESSDEEAYKTVDEDDQEPVPTKRARPQRIRRRPDYYVP